MADALPTAVILAGGLARRMGGGDKPLRAVAGRPLLARVIERLQPQCRALALNANGDPARFAPFGLPVIADSVQGFPVRSPASSRRWIGPRRSSPMPPAC